MAQYIIGNIEKKLWKQVDEIEENIKQPIKYMTQNIIEITLNRKEKEIRNDEELRENKLLNTKRHIVRNIKEYFVRKRRFTGELIRQYDLSIIKNIKKLIENKLEN